MDWESIKYVFQIPVSWYRKIHNMVFNAYGTNFIQVKEGYYGGMEISLDEEAFNRQLSGQLSGAVKSVDWVEPDGNGNIELCAVTLTGDQTIYGTKTFASNAYLSSQPGMPDANSLALATVGHVNTFYARKSHDHGNLNNDGTITNIGSGIATDYYIAADSNGTLYRKNTSDIVPSMSGYVTEDELTNYVQQSELTDYVQQSQLTDYVQHSELTDYVTQSELTDYVTQSELTDYVTQSELTDYVQHSELTDYVTQSELTGYATQKDIDDAIDAVEDELTAYARTDDFATGFPAATQNGQSVTNMKVITDVTWNGTYLKYKYRNLSFSKGLLTAYTNETTLTVDTPTVITWV